MPPVSARGRVLLLAPLAALALGLAACGGGGGGGGGKTAATTRTASTTATGPATESTSTAPSALASRLPPQDAVPGLSPGDPKDLPTVDSLIDALYQQGDPTRPAARLRFTTGGFQEAVLRDQTGTDPATGVGLLRTYVIRLGTPAAASREVRASVDEVKRTTNAPIHDIAVPGVPGARGLGVTVTTSGTTAQVAFITFAAGPYLYGYQAFARGGADLHLADIKRSVRDVYTGASSHP